MSKVPPGSSVVEQDLFTDSNESPVRVSGTKAHINEHNMFSYVVP